MELLIDSSSDADATQDRKFGGGLEKSIEFKSIFPHWSYISFVMMGPKLQFEGPGLGDQVGYTSGSSDLSSSSVGQSANKFTLGFISDGLNPVNAGSGGGPDVCIGLGFEGGLPSLGLESAMTLGLNFFAFTSDQCLSSVLSLPSA